MRWTLWLVTGLAAAACAGPPASTPAPPAPDEPAALAEAAAAVPGLTVRLLDVRRLSDAALEIRFALVRAREAAEPFVVTNEFAGAPADAGTVADVHAIDADGRRKYFVLRDAARRPSCSTDIRPLDPGDTRELWVRVAAPPADVESVAVQVPGVPTFLDVPVAAAERVGPARAPDVDRRG